MPRLWNQTIEAHRHAVRDAILDTTVKLASQQGLASVTMSRIAEQSGIGRATLYKYFSDVESILAAWHERQISSHLQQLADVRDQAPDPGQRLRAVLETYALIAHAHPAGELPTLLHRSERVARAAEQLDGLIRDLLSAAAQTGAVRDDVPPDELARYCVHALGAAATARSKAAVRRLVTVTLAGLRPPY